jgi:mRNA interferase RelE/StbE
MTNPKVFRISYSAKFHRQLSTLDNPVRTRIFNAVQILGINPFAGKPLHGKFNGVWTLRVGSFRVLYLIEDNVCIVTVLSVELRKKVYDF